MPAVLPKATPEVAGICAAVALTVDKEATIVGMVRLHPQVVEVEGILAPHPAISPMAPDPLTAR